MRSGRIAVVALLVVAPISSVAASGCPSGACGQATQDETIAFREWATGPASYLFSEKEKRIVDALISARDTVTSENLAAFRHWFWERRDPSAGTLANEFRADFESRVVYVNKEFGDRYSETPGWRTPKGLAYLMLGSPTRIEHREGHRYGVPDDSAIEVWVYELDDVPVLRLPFLEVDGSWLLLTTQDNPGLRQRLDNALARAAVDPIRNRDLPFTGASPLTESPPAPELPASGSLILAAGGIEAEISAPFSELYGQQAGEDLRIDLALALGSSVSSATHPLGVVTFLVQPADVSRWQEREMRIALWAPTDNCAGSDPELVVTELVSGRTLRLRPSSSPDAVARAYSVEHLFASADLANGEGKAVAFLGHAEADLSSRWTGLWVVRDPLLSSGLAVEEATQGPLALDDSDEDRRRLEALYLVPSCPPRNRTIPR